MSFSVKCQTEWHWYNPRPDGKGLQGVCMLDSTHAWAVGERGKILFYNGSYWTPQQSNTTQYLLSVSFFDTATGYAVGDSGTILKYDHGEWIPSSINNTNYYSKICLTSATEGWIAGDTLLQLVNGQWVGFPHPWTGTVDLEFISPNDGYLSDYNRLYHYDGKSWSIVPPPSNYFFARISDISFADQYHGLMIASHMYTNDRIIRYDHGNWDELTDVTFNAVQLNMIDSVNALLAVYDFDEDEFPNSGAMIKYNETGGYSVDNLVHALIRDMDIAADGTAAAIGYFGSIFLYHDDQWHVSNSIDDDNITDMDFPDPQHGWAVHSGGSILRWDMDNWRLDTVFHTLWFQDVHFSDSTYGWASGLANEDHYYKETIMCNYNDGCWHTNDTIPAQIEDVFVLDRHHAWATGRNALYYYNGHSWEQQYFDWQHRNFKTVFAVDSNHVWAAGEGYMYAQAVIWYYNENGWQAVTEDLANDLNSLWSFDTISAFITDRYSGTVMKVNRITGDISYTQTNIGPLTSLYMFDSLSGWVTSDYGMAAYFDGNTWIKSDFRANANLKVVTFADPEHGWIGGHEGAMLSTYAWSPLSISKPQVKETRSALLKAFPNPFLSEVTIEYYLGEFGKVDISIIDLSGKIIFNAIKTYKGEGLHNLKVNCAALTPGIYFCRMISPGSTQTVKLIK